MPCPYYDQCAHLLEDQEGFDKEDPACSGTTLKEWSLCNIYLDLAFNVYAQEAAEKKEV